MFPSLGRLIRICTSARRAISHSRLSSSLSTADASITVPALNASFPYVWLRDSCQCPQCIHPSTRQKLHRSSDYTSLKSNEAVPAHDGLRWASDGLHVRWGSGHESFYAVDFLERHSSPEKLKTFHKCIDRSPWDAASISTGNFDSHLYLPYSSLRQPSGLLRATSQLARYGIVIITDVPHMETSSDTCELTKLAELFGEIRTTFYGKLWDVKNVRNSRNIAYTNLDLGPHMDLMYFEHPPRYQILHCLRNRVEGGKSLFVDALHAAYQLYSHHPSSFDILTSVPVPFHYINDGHHLYYEHPTIELACPSNDPTLKPLIAHINYSPPFQAPLPLHTPLPLYSALADFDSILSEPANTFSYTLREGDAVMFDNRRIVHARTAFADKKAVEEGETNRWLKGCYLEADAVLDRARVLSGTTANSLHFEG